MFCDGAQVTPGQTITNFDVTKLEVYGSQGTTTVSFTYSLIDAAGLVSPPTIYQINTFVPLPVTLVSFDGKLVNDRVILNWRTSPEERFSHFEILRSVDAGQFEHAGNVRSSGKSTGSSYTFDMGIPTAKVTYYRLKMVDQDGSGSLSKVVAVETGKNTISVYPNPVTDVLRILSDASGTFVLYDVLGKPVQQGVLQSGDNAIRLRQPAGTYLLNVEAGGSVEASGLRDSGNLPKHRQCDKICFTAVRAIIH